MVRYARGTQAAPSAVQTGDELGFFAMTGYGATGFGEFGAGIVALAAENWTDTAQGTALAFAAGTGLIGTCVSDRRYKKDVTVFSPY